MAIIIVGFVGLMILGSGGSDSVGYGAYDDVGAEPLTFADGYDSVDTFNVECITPLIIVGIP